MPLLRGATYVCRVCMARYEADAQLAFLSMSGQCDVVITEDSDLLTFGCKRLVYKMDQFGNGEELRLG